MKKNRNFFLTVLAVVLIFLVCFGLFKFASRYVYFYVCPEEFLKNGGVKNIDVNYKILSGMFSVFPPMFCPAVKDFLKNQKNDEGLRALTLSCLPFLPSKYNHCVLEIETEYLNSTDTSDRPIAAQAIGFMGQNATPQLISAWKNGNDFLFKMQVAYSMLRIDDRSFIPVLESDIESDSKEAVIASVVLYEMTSDEKYKNRIFEILRNGSHDNRGLAIVFIGGIDDKKLIPFLKQALKDKDEKLRATAEKNMNSINSSSKFEIQGVPTQNLR